MSRKIYKVTSPSGKIYVGYTNYPLSKRKREHLTAAHKAGSKTYNTRFAAAIRKYGDQLVWEVIEDNILSHQLLKEREVHYISFYNSYKSGYNSTPGGDGTGRILSEETKHKLSDINIGKILTEETKKKISTKLKGKMAGEKNPMFGVKLTEEQLLQKSDFWVIVYPDDLIEEFSNLRNYCREKNLPFRSLCDVASGRKLHHKEILCFKKQDFSYDKVFLIRKKISENKVNIIITKPDGTIYSVEKIRQFSRENNLSHSCLIQVAKGLRKHHKGWTAK